MAYFTVFSADDSKKLVTILAKYLSVPESKRYLFQVLISITTIFFQKWSMKIPN